MSIRTDLVTEEITSLKEGFITSKETIDNTEIETTEIKSDEASNRIGKPKGKYCTIRFDRLDTLSETAPIKSAIVYSLKKIAGTYKNALVVGLGNTDITPDSLGPFCVNSVIATRHITSEIKKDLGLENLNTVACLIPGVLGKTGIEAVDIIKSAVNRISPDLVIVIDALAARTPENLCRTIQMSDSGIAPGSGVKNERKALNKETLGVPVIAIGIPTVIDANALSDGLGGTDDMMVTPKEIDLLISRSSALLSRAINIFLQPSLDEDTIECLS